MGVRIDTLLHWLCLQKSRSLAARACREGRILLNGRSVRPSKEVGVGDWISIANLRADGWQTFEIREVPPRQSSRADAGGFYRLLGSDLHPPGSPDA